MLLRIFLAPTSFLAAIIWTIWAQAAEPIMVLAPSTLRARKQYSARLAIRVPSWREAQRRGWGAEPPHRIDPDRYRKPSKQDDQRT